MMENTYLLYSDSESEVCSKCRIENKTVGDVVTELLTKGCSSWGHSWTLLERPLKVQGSNVPHIHGLRYGNVLEDEYRNGFGIARDAKGVYINAFTHWLGSVYCVLAIHLDPKDLSYVGGTVHQLAFGMVPLSEDDAILYLDGVVNELDIFKWSKGRKRSRVYREYIQQVGA